MTKIQILKVPCLLWLILALVVWSTPSIALPPFTHTVTIVQTSGFLCTGCSGTAVATVSGGIGPFGFDWSGNPSGQGTDSIYDVCPGFYMLTVTDSGDMSIAIGTISVSICVIFLSQSSISTKCPGSCDGQATVTPGAGIAPFTYSWSTGDTAQTVDSLCAGTYIVTVTDAGGDSSGSSVIVTEPTQLNANLSYNNVSCSGLCDASITSGTSGGTAPYSYLWDGGETLSSVSSLCAGSYIVTITDINGCVVVDSALILEPLPLTMAVISSVDITCFGVCDGTANLIAGNGTTPYSYFWSNGCSSASCSNLCAGPNIVSVTDNNGCQVSDSVIISEPDELLMLDSVNDATCNGDTDGSIQLTATGGTPFYTYSPSAGGTNMAAGTYTFTITDLNGCSVIKNITISEPSALYLSMANGIICQGDSISIFGNAFGGTTPFIYTWSNGYIGSEQLVSPSSDSTYTLTVTDSVGCTTTQSMGVSVYPIPGLQLGSSPDTSSNGNGLAWVSVSFPISPPYLFLWDDGLAQTTDTASGLSAGTFHVTITNANGCSAVDSIDVGNYTSITPGIPGLDLRVIPNPTTGLMSIIGIPTGGNATVVVYSSFGKINLVQELTDPLDISHLPDGMYMIHVFTSKGSTTTKVVKFQD